MIMSLTNRVFRYVALCIIAFIFIFPILWITITSLKNPIDATSFLIWSFKPVWSNYADAWRTGGFQESFYNTLLISVGTVILSACAGLLMAYSIVRSPVYGKQLLNGGLLTLRILPEMVFLLPLYVLYRRTGLFDTKIGMILAFQILTLPYSVWLLKSFILDVPEELENAARIDGCSEWMLLWRITFPIIIPGIAASVVLTFITVWTSLLFPLALSFSKAQTVSVSISSFKGFGAFNWPIMAAAALIVTVPQIILFAFINRYLISGLTAGAVKG